MSARTVKTCPRCGWTGTTATRCGACAHDLKGK